MPDINKKQLLDLITEGNKVFQHMYVAIETSTISKPEFIKCLRDIDNCCTQLRAYVVRHSRIWGQGIKKDGTPDRRFKANRINGTGRPDMRFSR